MTDRDSSRAETPAVSKDAVLSKDVLSGFLVFLIALPLCLGIAMASGFPPVAGVLTAIIGGILGTVVGSARLTIKGPAAGLIVIALGAVTELGDGDATLGYRRALAVGVVAAVIQILFAFRRVAGLGVAMPPSVVHGMLAAIGVIIISKQAHVMLGVTPHAKEPLQLLLEIPNSLMHQNPEVLLLGVVAFVILAGWPLIAKGGLAKVPAALLALVATIPLGIAFDLEHPHLYHLAGHTYELGPNYLLTLPSSILSAVTFPDFSAILSGTSIKYIVMFALVGTIESTLSVVAVDSLDPAKRTSNLDKDLLAVGVGNLVAAAVGGLPMISEIVRSKANIDAGATSKWSNFAHGTYLLLAVATIPALLHYIPLAVLGAMLVYTGLRLASPKEIVHTRHLGLDQLALFLTTMFVTLATDLLVGIASGIVLKLILHVVRGASIRQLFRPRFEITTEGDTQTVRLEGPVTFVTLMKLRPKLAAVGAEVKRVVVDCARATMVDHTFLDRLHTIAKEWPNAKLEILGLERMRPVTDHPHAFRRVVATPGDTP